MLPRGESAGVSREAAFIRQLGFIHVSGTWEPVTSLSHSSCHVTSTRRHVTSLGISVLVMNPKSECCPDNDKGETYRSLQTQTWKVPNVISLDFYWPKQGPPRSKVRGESPHIP